MRDSFPAGVAEQLKWYVYRLIDPRNGETFYVGKGQGGRVFAHANGQIVADHADVSDPKLKRIRDIKASGLEVGHIIHRHGIESSRIAHEVEAALIDAYPGLTNRVRGHGAKDYGSRHVEQIIDEYAGEEFEVKEPLMLISIGRVFYEREDPYDAVRFAWKINRSRVEEYKLVLARVRGMVVGAYQPDKWLPATVENFQDLARRYEIPNLPDRHGFVGQVAEQGKWEYYVRKRVPSRYRGKGIQSPVLYCDP